MTSITVFDGMYSIGGNKIFLEENEKGVFLDFGMNFKKYDFFFQEYLKERSTRGIYDLVQLDLIPKLNIYRKDLIPPDLDMTIFPKLDIEAVLISHPHMDHFGNLGLLDTEIPIISSPISLALMKGMADSSNLSLSLEAAFYSQKTNADCAYSLKAINGAYKTRNLVCTEKISATLMDFLTTNIKNAPNKDGTLKPLECGDICDLTSNPCQVDIKCFDVDHSIYGAKGFLLTNETTIAYTGDFRLHGKNGYKSKKFIESAKDASMLIIEGTRASRDDINESEENVYENCFDIIQDAKGVVVADFSARNFERLEIFEDIGNKLHREIVIPTKQVYLLKALEQVDNVDRTSRIKVFNAYKTSTNSWEKNFMINQVNYIDPKTIANAPQKYILCFSLYEIKHLLDIKPQNGTYIYSSSEAFQEESEFDFIRLNNWLQHLGFEIHGFEIRNSDGRLKPEFTHGLHASGHASKSDLQWAIDTIDPDYLIPIHTEIPAWFKENYDNAILLQEGEDFTF